MVWGDDSIRVAFSSIAFVVVGTLLRPLLLVLYPSDHFHSCTSASLPFEFLQYPRSS